MLDFCQSEVPYPVSVPAAVLRYCNAAVPSHFPYVSASGGRYSEKDLAMSILTVDRYKLDRDEATLLTWASPLRLPFGFLGVPSSVPRPAELLQPQLVIPETNDLFVSNLNKTFIALRELYRLYPDKPWFMQGSDDAYIDVQTLLLRLDELDSSDVLYVGGARNTAFCPTANASVTYIGGGLGFIVSNGFMKRYAEDIEPWMVREWGSEEMTGPRIFGDLMVGCFAHAHHVNVTHILGGHGEIPNAASMAWDEYPYDNGRWWGMHHINPPALLDIHLYMDLQRVDQLIVNEEWSALGNFSRILALEHHINAHRKLSLLESLKEDPSLLLDKVA